jgi:LPXTG-site transpeptidase (sortase) family protein
VGVALWLAQAPSTRGTTAAGGAASPPGAASTPATGTTAKPVLTSWRPGAPVRVRIPGLGVNAPVVPIGTRDDTLVPPGDPSRLGWWSEGARPGAKVGSALVTGHTVHTGGGALDDLETLRPGDRVVVRTREGRIPYAVARVEVFSKGTVADHAERLFSQEVPGRLVLVTCEDWDGSRYLSNVVVLARPVR